MTVLCIKGIGGGGLVKWDGVPRRGSDLKSSKC